MMELANKSVLVLGLGETGQSLVRWLSAQGARVRAADSRDFPPSLEALRTQFPQVELRCGVFRSELLDGIELIAISPGVPLRDPFVVHAVARGIPVVGDIELFAQQIGRQRSSASPLSPTLPDGTTSHLTRLSNNDSQVIGYRERGGSEREGRPLILAITGANGKTTVTSMVGAMCRAAGLDTEVAGNISPAMLDVVLERQDRQPDIWVLELSSFQLETTASLNADAATVLNISEDHLDRYNDMGEYIAAKARIFRSNGQEAGVQVLNRDDPDSAGMALLGRMQITFGLTSPSPASDDWGIEREDGDVWLVHGQKRVLNAEELQVTGLHNMANALAALALCRAVGLPMKPLLEGLRNFRGLPHRVERVAEINGVIYYDDSKGTNVGATIAALQGLGRPTVLIAGGEGKGQNFSPLSTVASEHARAVLLIGRDASLIAAALEGCGVPLILAPDMVAAVQQSAALAQPGDAVLLSPACASFDMFRNYEHRAEVFVAAVRALEGEIACVPQA